MGKHDLKVRFEVLHRNLGQRQLINNIVKLVWLHKKNSCGLYENGLRTQAGHCTVHELAKKYNFTYIYDKFNPYFILGEVTHHSPISSLGVQIHFLNAVKTNLVKNIWISYGCIYKQYTYVAFLSKADALDFFEVFSPFDILTACSFLGSIVTCSLILSGIILFKTKPKLSISTIMNAFRSSVFYPIKSIFEQGDQDIIIKYCKKTLAGYFLISSWLFLCFVFGNEYKGEIYSSMTSTKIPSVPESMVDLVMRSDMPFFTTTGHIYNGAWYSTLKDMVLADIILAYKKGSFMRNFLEKFRVNLLLANYNNELDIIYNISNKMTVSLKEGHELSNIEKFALVSNADDSDFFVGLMKKYTDYYVIPSKEDNLFVSRVPWHAMRNHMALRFSNGIARLEQSGIYNRWDRHYQSYEVIRKLTEVDLRLNVTESKYYGFVVMARSKLDSRKSKAKSLSLGILVFLFLGCGVLIGISIVALVVEWVKQKLFIRTNKTLVLPYFEFRPKRILINLYRLNNLFNTLMLSKICKALRFK